MFALLHMVDVERSGGGKLWSATAPAFEKGFNYIDF